MPYLDYQSVIKQVREQNPNLSKRLPDDDLLYKYLYKNVNPQQMTGNPAAEFEPPEDIFEARREQQEKVQIQQRQDSNQGKIITTDNPRGWLDFNLAGALGDLFDSNYLRYAATQGTADLSRMILTGKSGYQLQDKETGKIITPEEYAENIPGGVFGEVGAWILGQGNVADLAIWGLSGGLGKIFTTTGTKLVGKKVVPKIALSDGAQNWFQDKWAKSNVQKFATSQRKKNTPYSNYVADWVEGAPASMASIGAFSAAAGTVHSAVNQRKTNDDGKSSYNPETGAFEGTVNPGKVIAEGMYEGIKGTVLGGITAGVAPGLSKMIGDGTSKLQKSNSNFNKRLADLAVRFPKTTAGIPAAPIEGFIFGNLPYVIEGVPKDENGNTDFDTVWHDFMHGTVTVAGLKTTMGLLGSAGQEYKTYRSSKNLDKDIKNNVSNETINNLKKTLNDILPPNEVEKFLRTLSKEEKIKLSKKSSIDFEVDNFIDNAVKEAKKLEKIMEAPDFKLENLTREQKENVITAYNTLHVVKQVLSERILPENNKSFVANIKDLYNKTKDKDAPAWSKISTKEKNRFIKDKKAQLESFVKRTDETFQSFNDNVYKPIHASKEGLKTRARELADKTRNLEKSKQDEVVKRIKASSLEEIIDFNDKQLTKAEKILKEVVERKSPEQIAKEQTEKIEDIRLDLETNLKPEKGYELKEWIEYLDTKVDTKNPEKTIENFTKIQESRKKSMGQKSDYVASEKETKQSENKKNIPIKQFIENDKNLKKLSKNEKIALINAVNTRAGDGKTRNNRIKSTLNNLSDLMEKSNSKTLFELDSFDTINYLTNKIKTIKSGIIPTSLSSNLNKISRILRKKNVIKSDFSNPEILSELNIVSKQTKAISQAGKDISLTEVGQTIVDLRTGGKKAKVKLKGKEKAALDLMSETGIRDQEINALKWEHYDPKTKTLDLRTEAAGKSTGEGRYLYLTNKQAKQIEALKGNLKSSDFIFGKGMSTKITQALKQQSGNKKLTSKNVRKVVEQMAEDAKLNPLEAAVWEKITGHQIFKNIDVAVRNRLGKIYTGLADTKMARALQEAVLDKVIFGGKGITAKMEAKYKQRIPRMEKMTVEPDKPVGPEATRSEKSRFKEKFANKYPELTVELNKSKLKGDKGERLPENVLETVAGLEVKVRQGAPIEAAVHGMIHPIIKTLRAISKTNKGKKLGKEAAGLMREIERRIVKTKEFKKWYKQYIKEGMKPKEARDRAIEEATAVKMGEIVSGRLVDKTFFNRMTDWAKRVYTNIKTYFKDVSELKDNELFDLFGQKIYNRNLKEIPLMSFTQESKGKMQFMTVDKNISPSDLVDMAKKQIDLYAKRYKLNKSSKEALVEQLLLEAEVVGKDINMVGGPEAVKIINELQKVDYQAIVGNKDIIERLKINSKIKQYKKNTNITFKQEKEWFELNGQTDVVNASVKLLRDWKDIVYQAQDLKGARPKINNDIAETLNAKDVSGRMTSTTFNKLKLSAQSGLVGFNRVAKYLKLDKLHKWVSTHLTAEQSHIGRLNGFIARAEGRSYPMFSKARKQISKSWKAVEEIFGLLESSDKNGAFKRLNDPTVDKADKAKALKFIKKAFIVKTKKNKKTGQTEYFNEGINWDPVTKKGTLQGELMYFFKEGVMKHYVREFSTLIDMQFPKIGAREAFIKENGINFLNKTKKGFYIPIRFSDAFGEFYSPQSVQSAKKIQKVGREYAIDMAKIKYGDKYTKATTAEKTKLVNEFLEMGIDRARIDMFSAVDFGAGKVTVKNLITRNKFQFEQTIKGEKGEKIKVFDNNFESLMMPYSTGMSKLLANMEYAPWAVGLKGYSGTGDVAAMLGQASKTLGVKGKFGQKIQRIIKDGMMERTGTSTTQDVLPTITGITREYTATLMRLQLGGLIPLTGTWNIMEQSKQMVMAYKIMDVAKSFVKSFNLAERIATEDAGAVSSIGLLGYKPGQFNLLGKKVEKITNVSKKLRNASEWLFKRGGMPFTESFARTWARLASGMEMQRLTEHLNILPETSKRHKYAVDRLKSFYELSNGDIAVLKKYGLDPNPSMLKGNDVPIVKRVIKNSFRKAELVGNIKTAGTTVESMSAGWTNFKLVKPLLMYKKIAMSTSMNNMELMKYNLKHKHFLRTGLFLGGTYLKGVARIAVMKALFNQSTANVENTDWWTSFWATMYNGEFLGIGSEFLSPYKESWFSMQDNLVNEAAMTQNYKRTLSLLQVLTQSGANKINSDFANTFFGEQKMSVEDAGVEWLRSTVSSYNQYYKIKNQSMNPYNANYKQIQVWNRNYNKKHSFKGREDYEATESSMYFRKLRTVFNTGTKQEFLEELTLAYLGKVSDGLGKGLSEQAALKEAAAIIETKLKDLSPIPYSVDPNNDYKITPFESFFLTLSDEHKKITAKTYLEYYKKIKNYENSWQYFKRKRGIGDLMKNFDFKMDEKVLQSYLKKIKLK
mgnify:FL=1